LRKGGDFLEWLRKNREGISGFFNAIKTIVEGFVKVMNPLGVGAIVGFMNGFFSKTGEALEKMGGFFNAVANRGARELQSRSPSKVMHALGESIPQGLATGIDSQRMVAVHAMEKTARDVVSAAQLDIPTATLRVAEAQSAMIERQRMHRVEGFARAGISARMAQPTPTRSGHRASPARKDRIDIYHHNMSGEPGSDANIRRIAAAVWDIASDDLGG
jgi:hypothetical protein